MIRKYLILLLLFSALICKAQFDRGSFIFGYGSGSVDVSPFLYEYTPATSGNEEMVELSDATFYNRNVNIAMMVIEHNMFLETGLNIRLSSDAKSNFTASQKEGDIGYIKFSKGVAVFEDRLAFQIGFQYAFNRMEVANLDRVNDSIHEYKPMRAERTGSSKTEHYVNFQGAHMLGLNATVTFAVSDKLLIKGSYEMGAMYMRGVPGNIDLDNMVHKGKMSRIELLAYYYFLEDYDLGLMIGFRSTSKQTNSYDKDSGDLLTSIPQINSMVKMLNVGLLVPIPGNEK